jgi:hypothetical protein
MEAIILDELDSQIEDVDRRISAEKNKYAKKHFELLKVYLEWQRKRFTELLLVTDN